MTSPYDTAIAALEEEITALQAALQVLRRRSEDSKVSINVDFASVKVAHDGPTNEGAVRAILEAVHPQYIGTSRIVALGPSVGGRELNVNSVRWVLKHGVDGKVFDKKKESGRVSYRLNT